MCSQSLTPPTSNLQDNTEGQTQETLTAGPGQDREQSQHTDTGDM